MTVKKVGKMLDRSKTKNKEQNLNSQEEKLKKLEKVEQKIEKRMKKIREKLEKFDIFRQQLIKTDNCVQCCVTLCSFWLIYLRPNGHKLLDLPF